MDDFVDDTYHVKIMETKAMKNIEWAMQCFSFTPMKVNIDIRCIIVPLALFHVKFNVSSYI